MTARILLPEKEGGKKDTNKSTSFPNSNFEFGKGGEEEATTGWISPFLSPGTWYHPKTPQDTERHHKTEEGKNR